MLSIWQSRSIFVLFMLATAGFLGLEGYLLWAMIAQGFPGGAIVTTALNTVVLGACAKNFSRLIEKAFLDKEALPMERLHRNAAERNRIVEQGNNGKPIFETKRALVTNTLRFAEETLKGWVPGTHLELCVFINADQPLLFSYYDSQHDDVAKSMAARRGNPNFYIEKGYEVTKLLRQPSSHPVIIGDTHVAATGYRFTTDEQRRQIRSTLLLSLHLEAPIAMVVSSNEKNAFNRDDAKLMSFLKYVGELIRCDLTQGEFAAQVGHHSPELFPALPNATVELLPAQ
jgi:hypothetical protein